MEEGFCVLAGAEVGAELGSGVSVGAAVGSGVGSGEGSIPYAIAVYGDDVFSAGTLFGTSRTAAVWHGEKILHTLTDGTGHGEVYSMFVVPLYD